MQVANTTELAIKRPNESLAINPKKGRITLATRRLFNLLLFFSQKDGIQEVYSRSISEVMKHMNSSKDTEWLKDCFRSMQETSIEWNNKEGRVESWGISSLISEARIVTDANTSIIMWSLPRIVRERLADPRFYTKFTLEIYSQLRTGASIALYEICYRYLTNPSQVTNRDHWEWWEPRLTGNPSREKSEYRYFSRDVLRPAIAEVNRISNIEVELIEFKEGRKITEIQFKVTKKITDVVAPEELPVSEPGKEVDSSLLDAIVSLGLNFEEAKKICAQYDLSYVRDTVALAKNRAANTKLEPVNSLAAFFKSAILKKYALSSKSLVKKVTHISEAKQPDRAPTSENGPEEQKNSSQSEQALSIWKNKKSTERLELLNEFAQLSVNKFFANEISRRGLAAMVSRTLEAAFSTWYAEKLSVEEGGILLGVK